MSFYGGLMVEQWKWLNVCDCRWKIFWLWNTKEDTRLNMMVRQKKKIESTWTKRRQPGCQIFPLFTSRDVEQNSNPQMTKRCISFFSTGKESGVIREFDLIMWLESLHKEAPERRQRHTEAFFSCPCIKGCSWGLYFDMFLFFLHSVFEDTQVILHQVFIQRRVWDLSH